MYKLDSGIRILKTYELKPEISKTLLDTFLEASLEDRLDSDYQKLNKHSSPLLEV